MNTEWQPHTEKIKEEITTHIQNKLTNNLIDKFARTGFSQDLIDEMKTTLTIPIIAMEKCIENKEIDKYYSVKKNLKKGRLNFKILIIGLFLWLFVRIILWFSVFLIFTYLIFTIPDIKNNPSLTSFTENSMFFLFSIILVYFLKEDALLILDMQKFITKYEKHLKYLDYKAKIKK